MFVLIIIINVFGIFSGRNPLNLQIILERAHCFLSAH
jgi:hypothetical protein